MSAPNRFTDMHDDHAREYEADDLRRGVAGLLGEYYCFGCHHRHVINSAIGQRHERFGNPTIVRAAKRAVLIGRSRDLAAAIRPLR